MTTKIDLRGVIGDHFATLTDEASGKISKWDIVFFYGVPLTVGTYCAISGVSIGVVGVGVIIGALSILTGLLINVLVLLYTVREVGPTVTEARDQRELIKEVNANLIYAITVSIFCIVLLCVLPRIYGAAQFALTGAIVFLLGNFLLTLLMALKRLKTLLELRFKQELLAATPQAEMAPPLATASEQGAPSEAK